MENRDENNKVEATNVAEEAAPESVGSEGAPTPEATAPEAPEGSNEQGVSSKGAVAGLLAVVLLFAAFSVLNNDEVQEVADSGSGANGAAVLVAVSNEEVGSFLTDEAGRTLYVRDRDCTGGCLDNWPPYLYDGEPVLGELGLKPRSDTGELQYTYNDGLLYYFAGDQAPGDTNGHGQNGWSVIRPN